MNGWQCQAPGCTITAAGVGSAYGLRAIGWYFREGPIIFCPRHRPDPVVCHESIDPISCEICAATDEAKHWQDLIERTSKG